MDAVEWPIHPLTHLLGSSSEDCESSAADHMRSVRNPVEHPERRYMLRLYSLASSGRPGLYRSLARAYSSRISSSPLNDSTCDST